MPRNDRTEWENQLCRAHMPALPWDKLPPLPPLPPITNPRLSKMVFTHTSVNNLSRLAHTSVQLLTGQAGVDYEKLEHVGDAILEACAVTMAHELYPNTRQGGASIIRDRLVANVTLAQIAVQYGLQVNIISDPSMRYNLKSNQKVQASIFEAYVAGLYYSYLGTDVIDEPEPEELQEEGETEEGGGSDEDDEDGEDAEAKRSDGGDNKEDETVVMEGKKGDGGGDDSDVPSHTADPIPPDQAATADDINPLDQSSAPSPPPAPAPAPVISGPCTLHRPTTLSLTPTDPSPTSTPSPIDPIDTHSLFTSSSNSDPPSQRPVGPAPLIKRKMRRGEAFELVFDWLSQVLTPICHFIVEILVAEEDRLGALRPARPPKWEMPVEWLEEDRRSVGGKGTLFQVMTRKGGEKPVYAEESVQANYPSGLWKVTCTVVDWEGKEWQADATRATKHLASNAAAWKVCVKTGILGEDE
ncbi:hypothetical protein IAT38_007241 [Cryptococcus sp. DSM 104549]